jgi:hypothetical protein
MFPVSGVLRLGPKNLAKLPRTKNPKKQKATEESKHRHQKMGKKALRSIPKIGHRK